MARNRVELKLIRGNQITSNSTKPDIELYKKQVAKGKEKTDVKNPAIIFSLVDYPIVVEYGDEKLRLSPRCKLQIADHNLLDKESLPKGKVALKLVSKKAPSSSQVSEESEPKPRKSRKKVTKKN